MAIASHVKTYTLTDLKVAPVTGDTPGTLVDVPGIRSLEVTVSNDATELRGDNSVLAIIDQGNGLEWSMEAGGLDLDALAVILGGEVVTTGTTPASVDTFHLNSDDQRPYFAIVGVQPDDGAGEDLHIVVWKAKATGNFAITAADQEFLTPTIEGRGVGRSDNQRMLSLVHHETAIAAALPA
jgi:hypothetical protein